MKLSSFFNISVLLLGSLVVLACVALIYMNNYQRQIGAKVDESIESVRASEELNGTLNRYNREELLYKVTKNENHLVRRQQAGRDLQYWIEQVNIHADPGHEQSLVNQIRAELNKFLSEFESISERKMEPARAFHAIDLYRMRLTSPLEELVQVNLKQARDFRDQLAMEYERSKQIGVTLVFLFVAIAGSFVLVIRNQVYRPLLFLKNTMERYAKGDLEVRSTEAGLKEIKDITHTFNEMLSILVKQRETQLNFLAALAHDLKNPLGAIKMSAKLIADEEIAEAAERKQIINIIERQADKLEIMVGDLLDTARFEVGQFRLAPEKTDIRDLINESVQLYQPTSTRHSIHTDIPPTPLECYCDPVRISQVINNLLSNAIKYSPNGGDIWVRATREGGDVLVSVTDSGIGISGEDKTRIFQPFRRAKGISSNIPGVGLGLSVVRRIIEAHRGRIELESRVNVGTTMSFRIPTGERKDASASRPQPTLSH